mmetsp:Transcript_10366/g.36453  ORF Transcript_10366/g.36453 Transcript_10366/m.36453 type:complete len:263 (-) Transcript_10366:629-1417(-)
MDHEVTLWQASCATGALQEHSGGALLQSCIATRTILLISVLRAPSQTSAAARLGRAPPARVAGGAHHAAGATAGAAGAAAAILARRPAYRLRIILANLLGLGAELLRRRRVVAAVLFVGGLGEREHGFPSFGHANFVQIQAHASEHVVEVRRHLPLLERLLLGGRRLLRASLRGLLQLGCPCGMPRRTPHRRLLRSRSGGPQAAFSLSNFVWAEVTSRGPMRLSSLRRCLPPQLRRRGVVRGPLRVSAVVFVMRWPNAATRR